MDNEQKFTTIRIKIKADLVDSSRIGNAERHVYYRNIRVPNVDDNPVSISQFIQHYGNFTINELIRKFGRE